MTAIAIANQKGGVGKTTTAVNLAAALGERGVPTLLVDLDPQASASSWLGAAEAEGSTLLDALTSDDVALDALVCETSAPGVSVVPAGPTLLHADRELASVPGGDFALRRLLEDAPATWSVVLLDSPPQLARLTASALLAADQVLVPVEASSMALDGLAAFLQTFRRTQSVHPGLDLAGILACRVDYRNNLSREVVATLSTRFPDHVLTTVVRDRVRLREAAGHQLPITRYEPNGDAAADYRAVAEELFPQLARSARRGA